MAIPGEETMQIWMVCACLLAVCSRSLVAQNQSTGTTLGDLIKSAVERNGELTALQQRIAESEALMRQAGVRPAPSIEIEGGAGRPLGSAGDQEYRAGYSQPIELGNKRSKRLRVAEFSKRLAEAELSGRTTDFAAQLETSYLQLIYERERMATLDRALQTQHQVLDLTNARVREGDAPKLDSQLLSVEISRTEAQRALVEGRRESAEIEFRRLTGLEPSEPLPILHSTAGRAGLTLAEMQKRALEQRADLRAARILEQQAEAEIELTEAQAKPDVTLSARYGYASTRIDDMYGYTGAGALTQLHFQENTLSFGASLPLTRRSRSAGLIDAAVARSRAGQSRRAYLERGVPLEVAAAYARWSAALRNRDLMSNQVLTQSQANLSVIREAYQLGQLRLLDVLNEQRRLFDTELAVLDARFEVARALVDLERSTGEILP
jgi:outer membrane protein, heavy metal efflux system